MELGKLLLVVLLLSFTASIAHAGPLYYFTEQMNFASGIQRNHTQLFNYSGNNLSVVIPSGFTITNISHNGTQSGGRVIWDGGTERSVNFTMRSPTSCTEGATYEADIYVNNTVPGKFVFVCINDSKIVDYIAEYGHGDANYLTEPYISNETTTIFNLIRVFNIGSYLSPNEAAANAIINCTFEKYPVRTFGRVEVNTKSNSIEGLFNWDIVESGYWFRLGVLSQDVSNKAVGEKYNVTCTELTYNFTHQRVRANFTNYSLEVRNAKPFTFSIASIGGGLSYTITNTEVYAARKVSLRWQTGNYVKVEDLPSLGPNESVRYDLFLEGSGTVNFTVDYMPPWYANSRNPVTYSQKNTSGFSVNSNPVQISDLNYVFLKTVNTTVTNIRSSQTNNFRVELSDFGHLNRSGTYRARLLIFDYEGRPLNASSNVTILIYNPIRAIIVRDNMTYNETGVYLFNYTLDSTQTSGAWETIVEANVSGVTVKPNDFWTLAASPAEVRIDSCIDNTIPTLTVDASITNEGDADQEYQYEYCLVTNQSNPCGGSDDVDYRSAAKLIAQGQTFSPFLTLNANTTGRYYFKLVVYYGVEASGASIICDAVPEPPPSTPAAGGGGGGGGGGFTPVRVRFMDFTIQPVYTIEVERGDVIPFTIDGIERHTLRFVEVEDEFINITVQSDPINLKILKGQTKEIDVNGDGLNDMAVTLVESKNGKATVVVRSLAQYKQPECIERWRCDDWKDCGLQNLQTRDCIDLNSCGTLEDKPPETRACVYEEKPTTGVPVVAPPPEFVPNVAEDFRIVMIAGLFFAVFIILLWRRNHHQKTTGYVNFNS